MALDAQGQSVPVDGERLDPHRAVQTGVVDEAGETLDRVGVTVGEAGQQARLGQGEGIGRGRRELLEADDDRAGGPAQHDPRGPEVQVAVLGCEGPGEPEPGADTAWHRNGCHVGELQHGGRLAAG